MAWQLLMHTIRTTKIKRLFQLPSIFHLLPFVFCFCSLLLSWLFRNLSAWSPWDRYHSVAVANSESEKTMTTASTTFWSFYCSFKRSRMTCHKIQSDVTLTSFNLVAVWIVHISLNFFFCCSIAVANTVVFDGCFFPLFLSLVSKQKKI